MEPSFRTKSKKMLIIFLVIIAVAVVLTGLIYYQKSTDKERVLKNMLPNFIFNDTEVPQSTCSVSDQIKYSSYAGNDPLWKANNKFGLYVYAEEKEFFSIADRLVNSNGGDWGYVLIPYNVRDYDYGKWGRVFNQLIGKHLIPVIQLWNVNVDNYKKETKKAAEFLNTFLWPIRYRYISVYNEPNDDNFWYGKADASEYAKILDYTIKTFKENNEDFFMMNGAFNISALNTKSHIDAFEFMKQMDDAVPGIFDKLDAWASHPYPQPNFAGSPLDTGRNSIRAYEEELKYLKGSLNVKEELPVFITETGWAHAEGESYDSSYLPDKTVAEYLKTAFNDVWLKDDRVRAVMPFTIIYNNPYDHFSWVNEDFVPYFHYDVVKSMKKIAGEPPKLEAGGVATPNCEF